MYLERYKCAIITHFLSCNAAVLNTALKYCVSNALIFGRFVSRLFVYNYNYYHVYNFEFVYKNKYIFLSSDHIWNNRNLDSHISQTHWDISFELLGI